MFIAIALHLHANGKHKEYSGLSLLKCPLRTGTYRVVKEVESVTLAGKFEIKCFLGLISL